MRLARMSSSSAVIPLDPFRSQGSQRIIMTGSTQAMSYISVSGPPGLRMRRRNPPVIGRIGVIPPSSSVRPNCPHLLKILVRAPDTPPVATQPEVRSTCVAFHCHQNCSSPHCHYWWPSSALLALSIRGDLEDVAQARRGAQLGSTWEPLIASIQAIESEQRTSDTDDAAAIVDARQRHRQLDERPASGRAQRRRQQRHGRQDRHRHQRPQHGPRRDRLR